MKQFKVVLLGDTYSGKSSLLNLYFDKPNPLYTSSGGPNYFKHQIRFYEKEKVQLNLWDSAGQEKFFQMNLLFLKSIDPLIVIICYRMKYENDSEHIQLYIDSVKSSNGNAKIIILGTHQNLGEHENQKNIEKQFSDFPFYKVGLNAQEILNQIFYNFYDELIAQQTLIQQELRVVQEKKQIKNQYEQNMIKQQNKKGFWGLCSYEYDD